MYNEVQKEKLFLLLEVTIEKYIEARDEYNKNKSQENMATMYSTANILSDVCTAYHVDVALNDPALKILIASFE